MKLLFMAMLFLLISCEDEAEFFKKDVIEDLTPEKVEVPDSPIVVSDPDAPAVPQVTSPGTVTILLALGDLANSQLVVKEESARAIAQNSISFASPVSNPKILVIKDFNHQGESVDHTQFIRDVLLKNYETEIIFETSAGIIEKNLEGFDVVWFNNPGYPMGLESSKNILKNFKGGVILSGDDLSVGRNFSMTDLTGLVNIDNGTQISCANGTFNMDNNNGYQYIVSLESKFLIGLDADFLSFPYGNDIDLVSLSNESENEYEVLAYAAGESGTCNEKRPVIVRYQK